MSTHEVLHSKLMELDGKSYKSYKEIRGEYDFGGCLLCIDYVQGDPFASPSKLRVRVPHEVTEIPSLLFRNEIRRMALEDFLAREARHVLMRLSRDRGIGKSGQMFVDAGRQEILERTAVSLTDEWLELRMEAGLPAAGRKILGRQAAEMLCMDIPELVDTALRWYNLPQADGVLGIETAENYLHIQSQLEERGLIAFVANGSLLPRESGASDRPMRKTVIPFQSPPELEVEFRVPNPIGEAELEFVTGMGIPKGVTLIVGGGYHGKSTLLQALSRCVYPHIPGDGREYVVTHPDAVKIRAEDGRCIQNVDISPFINNLPGKRNTRSFSSEDASGSTSQAANLLEAIEVGASALLLDEDTSATNFMIRDARMQALVSDKHEPITPLIERVRELYEEFDVSTIMVVGGCGDYFDVADTVIMMKDYLPQDVSEQAREIANTHPSNRAETTIKPFNKVTDRAPIAKGFDASRGHRDVNVAVKSRDMLMYGETPLELRGVEQVVDPSQTRAIGYAIHMASKRWMDGELPLNELLNEIETFFDNCGLEPLAPFRRGENHPGNLARPRRYEIAAAINRLRTAKCKLIRN